MVALSRSQGAPLQPTPTSISAILDYWPESFSLSYTWGIEIAIVLGERSDQRGLWEADRLYLDHVGRDTFYGLLASLRGRLFRDADFAEYCPDNGRDSVPPSLLATALLLQSHDKVSDAEAKARADFDLRWKVALGIEVEDDPSRARYRCCAQLILHDKGGRYSSPACGWPGSRAT